jgi:Fur family peroxide stress response transcriptional regulator
MISLIEIKDKLAASGLKVTQQRLVIYDALIKSLSHPTAEEIYEEIKSENPALSVGTVYKTLQRFVQAQLIRKVSTVDHLKRFDANLAKHNHIYLENTKEIIDYEDEDLQQVIVNYLKSKNLINIELTDVQLQINAKKINKKLAVSIK